MGRPYSYKYGTKDNDELNNILDDLFVKSELPENINDVDETLQLPILTIDLDEIGKNTQERATRIAEKLSAYYFDQKYIDNHPYITDKIEQEIDNIRRLLKMLAINEKAQDTLIMSITSNSGKGALYTSLTSMQNSMLSMQSQLNLLTSNLEDIFKEMQDNCEKTFEEKDKERLDDGSMIVRGSRDFIKEMNERIAKKNNNQNNQSAIS
jgi:hypothetical protein